MVFKLVKVRCFKSVTRTCRGCESSDIWHSDRFNDVLIANVMVQSPVTNPLLQNPCYFHIPGPIILQNEFASMPRIQGATAAPFKSWRHSLIPRRGTGIGYGGHHATSQDWSSPTLTSSWGPADSHRSPLLFCALDISSQNYSLNSWHFTLQIVK